MRTLKFRAWDGEEMISPDHIDREGRAFWKSNSFLTSSDKVMQFTGLHDKNGREIYEGDIVTGRYGRAKVGWFDAGFQPFCGDVNAENPAECEVIGNIYEHGTPR